MMNIDDFLDKIMLAPYVIHGRDWDGIDCWGPIYLAYREVLGIEIPEYKIGYATHKELQDIIRCSASNTAICNPIPLAEAEYMDVVLLNCLGLTVHAGLMMDNHNFLHIQEDMDGAAIESLRDFLWKDKVEGVYRHASRSD